MFGNLGLHVIKNPAGTYSYVGSIPTVLGYTVPANTSAVLGCRAFRNDAGELVEWKFPVFKSRGDAILFAVLKGCEVKE